MADAASVGDFTTRLANGVRKKEDIHKRIEVCRTDENGIGMSLARDDKGSMRLVHPCETGGKVVSVF